MKARAIRRQGGFTMLEILVTLLILLIGLLGLAGLLVTVQQGEVEAYQRKQAMILMQDMVDRLTANHESANCYAFSDASSGSPWLGTAGSGHAGTIVCGSGSATQQARASADLADWNNALLGVSEKSASSANVGSIIEARGCVASPSAGLYRISVAWRGLSPTAAPTAAYTCGRNEYKDAGGTADERLRRVISVTIRIANLKA